MHVEDNPCLWANLPCHEGTPHHVGVATHDPVEGPGREVPCKERYESELEVMQMSRPKAESTPPAESENRPDQRRTSRSDPMPDVPHDEKDGFASPRCKQPTRVAPVNFGLFVPPAVV